MVKHVSVVIFVFKVKLICKGQLVVVVVVVVFVVVVVVIIVVI